MYRYTLSSSSPLTLVQNGGGYLLNEYPPVNTAPSIPVWWDNTGA